MKKNKKEWVIAFGIVLLAIIFNQAPLFIGYATAGTNEIFMGIPVHVTDTNNHLNLILQVAEGHILLTNTFTPEPVPPLLLNPYHLLVGLMAITFESPLLAFQIFSVVAIIFFFLFAYHTIEQYTTSENERLISFFLLALSSGFGLCWIVFRSITGYWFGSVDLWLTDLNTFTSLSQPHFLVALMLLLGIFHYARKGLEHYDMKSTIIAGVFGLVLAFTHLFDIITMTAVLTVWTLVLQYHKGWKWKRIWHLAVIGIIIAPGVLYYGWVFLFNPLYASWNALNDTTTPDIIRIISALGTVFFAASYTLWSYRKKLWQHKNLLFLGVWTITQLAIAYLPFNVQRRFLLGIHIPLSILAGVGIVRFSRRTIRKKWQNIFIGAILLFASLTTIYITTERISTLHEPQIDDFSTTKYLRVDEVRALVWIDQHIANDAVILAPYYLGNYIPAITGNRVFVGHWAQTINYSERLSRAINIYSTGNLPSNLPVDYIIWPKKTVMLDNNQVQIYENNELKIYKYRNTSRKDFGTLQ